MQLIGKSKVTKLNAKAGIVYPLIRLPKIYAGEIGKTAEIFETKHENKRVLVVTFDDQTEVSSEVIQLTPKVIQPHSQQNLESTLCELESQITELKSLISENPSCLQNLSKKEAPESGFEPESEPRQGSMIGRYTTRACTSVMAA